MEVVDLFQDILFNFDVTSQYHLEFLVKFFYDNDGYPKADRFRQMLITYTADVYSDESVQKRVPPGWMRDIFHASPDFAFDHHAAVAEAVRSKAAPLQCPNCSVIYKHDMLGRTCNYCNDYLGPPGIIGPA